MACQPVIPGRRARTSEGPVVLRIRLRRAGKKKQPFYRLVVADSRAPRDGAFIETIGTYDPLTQPATVTINEDRALDWLGKGAVPSDRAMLLLASKGLVEKPVLPNRPKKSKDEPPESAAPPATAAAAPATAVAASDAASTDGATAEPEAADEAPAE